MAQFPGFYAPRYTSVPDQLFDELLPDLSGAELKVLLYIIRRTFGFKKDSDNISLSQMTEGIRRRVGVPLDRGTGLSKRSVLAALASLEEGGYIIRVRRQSAERGDEATTYRLRMFADEEPALPVVQKVDTGGNETSPGPWGKNFTTQETVIQETEREDPDAIDSLAGQACALLRDYIHRDDHADRLRSLLDETGATLPDLTAALDRIGVHWRREDGPVAFWSELGRLLCRPVKTSDLTRQPSNPL